MQAKMEYLNGILRSFGMLKRLKICFPVKIILLEINICETKQTVVIL